MYGVVFIIVVMFLPMIHSRPKATWVSCGYPSNYADAILALSLQGLVNRQKPQLWFNTSAPGWTRLPAVMWPFPNADVTWRLELGRKVSWADIDTCDLCVVIDKFNQFFSGVVKYSSNGVGGEAAQFLAVTASGLHNALPVTDDVISRHTCLHSTDTILTIPTFKNEIDAYVWGIDQFLPHTSQKFVVGTCRKTGNYTCGWGDPLGTATIDIGVASQAFMFSLSPDTSNNPHQAALFKKIISHLKPLGALMGWAEPEAKMVNQLSGGGGVVLCGAPNLSFLSSLGSEQTPSRLPLTSKNYSLNRSKYYVIFQSNEGDTLKNAYSLREGQWLERKRGEVSIGWGVDPLIAEFVPGLWNYYADTSLNGDEWFHATAGAGYTYPFDLPESVQLQYYEGVGELARKYMPHKFDTVDVWEGGLNKVAYQNYRDGTGNAIMAFSQQSTGDAINTFLNHGEPLFLADKTLWYPTDKGYCNPHSSDDELFKCYAANIQAVAKKHIPPFFILCYGCSRYVKAATGMNALLGSQFEIIGSQGMANLGFQASSLRRFLVTDIGQQKPGQMIFLDRNNKPSISKFSHKATANWRMVSNGSEYWIMSSSTQLSLDRMIYIGDDGKLYSSKFWEDPKCLWTFIPHAENQYWIVSGVKQRVSNMMIYVNKDGNISSYGFWEDPHTKWLLH